MNRAPDRLVSLRALQREWDQQNRKGVNLARMFSVAGEPFDADLENAKRGYSQASAARKDLRDAIASHAPASTIKNLKDALASVRTQRLQAIDRYLETVRGAVDRNSFSIEFALAYSKGDAAIYRLSSPFGVNFMACKLVEHDLRQAFNLRTSSRDEIVARLAIAIEDDLPKLVVRADVKKFYESIPHGELLSLLREQNGLSSTSLRLVRNFLADYERVAGASRGLPRGVSLSAALAEAYMKSFDDAIAELGETVFYARFVDDIIIVLQRVPTPHATVHDLIEGLLASLSLRITDNPAKLYEHHHPGRGGSLPKFEYLGYAFRQGGSLAISMSSRREDKLRRRIELSFDAYTRSAGPGRRASTLLYQRLLYLTSNARLLNNKRSGYTGIRFSNRHMNQTDQLDKLDKLLTKCVAAVADPGLKKRLAQLSFRDGFDNTKFSRWTITQLTDVTSLWKHDG